MNIDNLRSLTKKYDSCILYKPLKDEIDYTLSHFPLLLPQEKIILPSDKNSDPFELVDICMERCQSLKPFILIPGRKFDIYGARIGHGYGWYDRFLSKLPQTWLRIGVGYYSQLSIEKIETKIHDQKMDIILILKDQDWKIYKAK